MNPDGRPAPPASIEERVAAFLEHASASDTDAIAAFLATLAADEREEARSLIQSARLASSVFPRQIRADTVLGGRYRVLNQIGSGGMGKVFSAIDEQLERRVAVKVLDSLAIGDPTKEQMFQKESRLLAALQHPGIVSVHELGRDGDLAYLAMDLVDGVSIAEVISRVRELSIAATGGEVRVPHSAEVLEQVLARPTPHGQTSLVRPHSWIETAARILTEIARTVEAAHGCGVLHRDLKPSNVMLRGGALPVVLDFGLAGSTDSAGGEVTQGLYGSLSYLAPEQAASHRVGNDPRTDVYQLGLILYELLTLKRAFPGHELGPVLERIRLGACERPRKLNPDVPPELEAICWMATEHRPEHRYATARELREDLERFLSGTEVPLAARGRVRRLAVRQVRYFARRNPRTMAAAAVALVAVSITWAAYRHFTRWSPPELDFLALSTNQPTPTRLLPESTLSVDDNVLVKLTSRSPSILYALWISQDGDMSYVKPVHLSDGAETESNTKGWAKTAEAGRQTLHGGKLERPHGESPRAGLRVIACPEPQPLFEAWFDELDVAAADWGEEGGVPNATATLMLQGFFNPTRGGTSLAQLPDSEKKLIQRALQEESQDSKSPWVLGSWRYEGQWVVRK